MSAMRRPWLLLVCVPLVARGDASTPAKTGGAPALASIEYAKSDGDGRIEATRYPPGTRLFLASDGRPAAVVERRSDTEYVVDVAGEKRTLPFVALTPFAFDLGGGAVTVGFDAQFRIVVRAKAALVLDAAGQGYLSRKGGNVSATLVDGIAPLPLIKLASRPEACSDFWEIYVSVVDGVPRKALELGGVADPPVMMSSTVKFARNQAVVTTRTTEEDGGRTRTRRARYRWNGTVFEPIVTASKRAPTVSK